MILFKLLTKRYPVNINLKLLRFISNGQLEGVDIIRNEEDGLQVFCVSCTEDKQEEVREMLATIVSDIVQEAVLEKTMDKLLKTRQTLSQEEKESMRELFVTSHYVSKEEGASYISYYKVYVPILKEIEAYKQLHVEGWIRFRTKIYEVGLTSLLENAISNYEKQRDYLDYIKLIVESRRGNTSCSNELNLVADEIGEISIRDAKGNDLTKTYTEQYCQEFLEEESITDEDLILHILIMVPPNWIKIHGVENFANKQFLQTIQIIFEERILYCMGCELCKNRKNP